MFTMMQPDRIDTTRLEPDTTGTDPTRERPNSLMAQQHELSMLSPEHCGRRLLDDWSVAMSFVNLTKATIDSVWTARRSVLVD
jgi:hypothetical protein